ncbi:C-type lectin domain family 17, member A-like [Pomacea canaliculata]|uniref:C-type lectin domain family 17, member A-like n=1 Tax=Pomacea canaliculata TaxID=400727 RepID=UPI000D726A41|nr:C-type lectin domain family 17, member A-like [Pomacea canaliculata]
MPRMVLVVALSLTVNALTIVCARSTEVKGSSWTRSLHQDKTLVMEASFTTISALHCAAVCSSRQVACPSFAFDAVRRLCCLNITLTQTPGHNVTLFSRVQETVTSSEVGLQTTTGVSTGVIISTITTFSSTLQTPGRCSAHPDFYLLADGSSCIKPDISKTFTWAGAQTWCAGMSATLARIRDVAKRDAITNALKNAPNSAAYVQYWVDGSDQQEEGSWVWGDGWPVDFSIFNAVSPPNDTQRNCLVMTVGSPRSFKSEYCINYQYPLCEMLDG